jgi:hypothetical protein
MTNGEDGDEKIGKISLGTASQLRSIIINMESIIINMEIKKMYNLDSTRTKRRANSDKDLMSNLQFIPDGIKFFPINGTSAYFNNIPLSVGL